MKHTSSSLSLGEPANIPGLDRDNDPATLSFRYGNAIELKDIASNVTTHLRAAPPTATSSTALPTESVWGSKKASSMTKPTSHGTNQSAGGYNGKQKGVTVCSASSLSATHGSGSDTDREAQREEDTLGVGSWAGVSPSSAARTSTKRGKKPKKPQVVVFQQHRKAVGAVRKREEHEEEPGSVDFKGTKYLRRRRTKLDDDVNDLGLAEEGRGSLSLSSTSRRRLSRLRICIITGFLGAIVLTLSLAAWGISLTNQNHKHQMYRNKAILFGSVTLIFAFTAIIMVAARRVLVEVLLMAVVEFLIGSMLLLEIGEFMEHT